MLVALTFLSLLTQNPGAACDDNNPCGPCEECANDVCVSCPTPDDQDYCSDIWCGPDLECKHDGATGSLCAGIDSDGNTYPAVGTAFLLPVYANGSSQIAYFVGCNVEPVLAGGYALTCYSEPLSSSLVSAFIGPGFCGSTP